jgi:2'-5' RNA ligase
MRCFIAVRPDEATRLRLDEVARRLHRMFPRSRRLRASNLHLTLAFIGELAPPGAATAARAMQALAFEPLDWTLDRVGHFARARVVWAGGEDPAVTTLAGLARAALRAVNIAFDPKPFVAHVSLLRDVVAAAGMPGDGASLGSIEPIPWRIERAETLVSERDGAGAVRYRALDEA